MFRFVAMMWDEQSPQLTAAASDLEQNLKRSAPGWERVFACSGARVWLADRSPCFGAHLFCDAAGVVLGEAFANAADLSSGMAAFDAKFNRKETLEALESRGRSLVTKFWGNFVALLVKREQDGDNGVRYLLKDPSGTLPCHFAESNGVQVIFSSLQDCLRMGLSFAVNWEFVRTRAVNSFLDSEIPTLVSVSTVHRGECVSFDHRGVLKSRSLYWHPSRFDGAADNVTDPATAAKLLRGAVRSCVHSMARHHASILMQTSGGLDSSIVLGCLGDAPTELQIACYTIYASQAVCDERRWARLASRGQYRHIEICREATSLVFRDLPALARTMEPASYFSHWQRGPLDREMAAEQGATATFTGEGGDSTLCATTYSYAAEHAFRRHGLKLRTFKTALQVASRRDRTVWKVLGKAIAREMFGAGRADELRRRAAFSRLVSLEAKRAVDQRPAGTTWMNGGGRLSEETRLRLGALLFPPVFYDLSTSAGDASPYIVSPLFAQPVVEAALRIPVDLHFDGGRIRGLARRAFEDLLPAPIFRRQWKDRPLLFFEEIIQANLPFMREHLLDGELVKRGILDRAAVELALKNGPTRSSADSGEILSHLDLELWIRDSARSA
jgi:asparagine synthase (glutamine-hydrolysing)